VPRFRPDRARYVSSRDHDDSAPASVGAFVHATQRVELFEPTMPFHKYKIGQRVSYRPSRSNFPVRYIVMALLPAIGTEFRYRIRRLDASGELIAKESDLRETRDR
jgi:hypothetical protein